MKQFETKEEYMAWKEAESKKEPAASSPSETKKAPKSQKYAILVTVILVAVSLFLWMGGLPDATVTFEVIDDAGHPVPNVAVWVSAKVDWEPGEAFGKSISKTTKAVTDQDARAAIEFESMAPYFDYGISYPKGNPYKDNYHPTLAGEYFFKKELHGNWLPRNPTIRIELKRILNPIPMYVRNVNLESSSLKLPERNTKYGYDLMVGDLVAPHGRGIRADFIVEVSGYYNESGDYDVTLGVAFSGKEDGIQPFDTPVPDKARSKFVSPYEAPLTGYKRELRLREFCQPKCSNDMKEKQNYFFRVRSVVNQKGELVGALYGKLYNGFGIKGFGKKKGASIGFGTYYLNASSNSRNIEFDRKNNLSEGRVGLPRQYPP